MIIRFIVLCFIVALTGRAVNAQDAPDVYVFRGTFFPFILEQDDEGVPSGLSVDILNRISELTGDPIVVKMYPWTRALQMAKVGTAQGIIGPYLSAEREKYLNYTDTHFYEDRLVLLRRHNRSISWQGDFTSLSTYTMLAINGWAYGPEFEAALPFLNVEKVSTAELALNMLCKERADLVALNERNALFEMKKEGVLGELSIMEPAFRTVVGYFAFSRERENSAFENRFNAALTLLATSGEIRKLSANYGLSYIGPADE